MSTGPMDKHINLCLGWHGQSIQHGVCHLLSSVNYSFTQNILDTFGATGPRLHSASVKLKWTFLLYGYKSIQMRESHELAKLSLLSKCLK
jgi:hypothetical protein